LIAANVSVMRLFGLGLTLAILVDATLVRMVLVPAFMHVMGQWIWWAPRWLVSMHRRLGFNEGPPTKAQEPRSGEIEPSGPRHRV
jgi:RND superfamily putative drug exporter